MSRAWQWQTPRSHFSYAPAHVWDMSAQSYWDWEHWKQKHWNYVKRHWEWGKDIPGNRHTGIFTRITAGHCIRRFQAARRGWGWVTDPVQTTLMKRYGNKIHKAKLSSMNSIVNHMGKYGHRQHVLSDWLAELEQRFQLGEVNTDKAKIT